MANNDFHDGIDVCVGNWGYYSEGELRDTWMHLPMDPDEIEPWLRGHGLVDEEHEETYISDYDGLPFRCPQVFNEYARLDKLNVLAMQLTLLPEGDLAHIQAAIDHGEPLSRLDELMNLVAQADELPRALDAAGELRIHGSRRRFRVLGPDEPGGRRTPLLLRLQQLRRHRRAKRLRRTVRDLLCQQTRRLAAARRVPVRGDRGRDLGRVARGPRQGCRGEARGAIRDRLCRQRHRGALSADDGAGGTERAAKL